MNKEEQFKTLQNVIKDFVIDNKEFDTKEEAEKYVEEELDGDIKALIEDDDADHFIPVFEGYEVDGENPGVKFWID